MPYETGTATDPVDLLKKIAAFLGANGWTVNENDADTNGSGNWRVCVAKAGVFANLRAQVDGSQSWSSQTSATPAVHLYCSSGYAAGLPYWDHQAGGPVANGTSNSVGVAMPLPAGAITAYHFFLDAASNFIAVVEKTTGNFGHLGWGVLDKAGAYTGGTYFFGPISGYYSGYNASDSGRNSTARCPGTYTDDHQAACFFFRADVDTFTGKWLASLGYASTAYGYTGKFGASPVAGVYEPPTDFPEYKYLQDRLTSTLNGQANLLPVRAYANRDAGGYSLLGTVSSVFVANACANGVSPATEYQIGPDTYMLFPNFAVKKVA